MRGLTKDVRQMAKAKRMMAYSGPGRPYLERPGRRTSHPHSVIERLLGTKLPDLEGEAVGFLLFGKSLRELREW